eukprot:TRINITY_DN172_c0_g1_i1.p1 TRINITY_DN172_c0_g1~~TRINITY_DN172_c0_g1_i1.p1  ORF type:complete len:328 (-),score=60.63 TRINITY_DN172_c0_g1_i1:82-993(-)
MMKLIFVVLLAIVTFQVFAKEQQANGCALYQISSIWGNGDLTQYFEPQPVPWPQDITECPSSISDGETCCKSSYWEFLKQRYQEEQSEIQQSQNEIKSDLQNKINPALDWWNSLTSQQKNAIKALWPDVEQVVNRLQSFANDYSTAFGKCAHSLLNYWVGIYCLACSDDPFQYVRNTTNGLQLQIASSTCTAIYSACSDLIDLTLDAFDLARNNPSSGCNNQCQQDICRLIVIGASINVKDALDDLDGTKRSQVEALTTTSNNYVAGGYDAHQVGVDSSLNNGCYRVIASLFVALFCLLGLLF